MVVKDPITPKTSNYWINNTVYVITLVCIKFNYDRLHIDQALGNFRECDNKNNNNNIATTRRTFIVLEDPFRVQK